MKKLLLLLLMASGVLQSYSQEQLVKGRITDGASQPLSGATVTLKGTSVTSTTDNSGNFQINTASQANPVLVVSFVGFVTQEFDVKGRSDISITLQQDVQSLNDVVVVGYGEQRKRDITGASTSIRATEIAKRPLTRLEQALQGTSPGVSVISPNGQPGQGLRVKIRGANSITGSTEPLYVIDGNIGGGSDVNVNDVETIEVLRDAAATGIYGSRASNGVVLITTKSGKAGKTRINFGTWVRHDQMPKELDLMNAYDFARSVNAQFIAQGSTAAFSEAELKAFQSNNTGTDWQDALHQSAFVQNYQLDASGGSEGIKYYVSLGYLNQPGVILNQWFKRTSFRANLDVRISDRINLKLFTVATVPQSHNNDYGGGLGDPFNQAVEWDPTSLIRDPNNGNYINHSQYASIQFNPVAQAESQRHDKINTNLSQTASLNFRITDDLTFTSTNVYSLGLGYEQRVDGPGTSAFDSKNDNAQVLSNRASGFLTSNFLNYKRVFGDHSITGTALFEYSQGQNTSVNATSKGLSTYALGYYNLGLGGTQLTTSGYSADALVSYMGRVNYTYKDKYTLSASLRTDGSSHLTNKYSSFPTVGVAWNAKNEDFLKNSNLFSDLKFRFTYGITGNQAVAAYSTIPVINVGGGNNQNAYYFEGGNNQPSVAVSLGTPVSSTLKWETKSTYDAGIDASFLNGRLAVSIDAYKSKVEDLLYSNQAPQYQGGGSYAANIGSVSNKGIEFGITGVPVSTPTIKWTTNLNFSMNRNKVLDLGGLDNVLAIGGNNTFNAVLKIGQPLGEFIGYQFLGTWKNSESAEAALFGMKPGDAKYVDLNGDHAYTNDDWMLLGNATPKYTYGFINDVSYKNFTFSIMIQGRQGSKIFSQTLAYLWGGLGDMKNATTAEAVPENLWTTGHETNNPAWSNTSHNFNGSSRYVYNSGFTKLRNISLTYSLPPRMLQSVKVNSLDVYISGQNLVTITSFDGYDPEIDQQPTNNAISQGQEFGVIPNPKSVTFGVRLGL